MSWWGKVVGGAFGFMLGGPIGAMLGAAFGHNFDKGFGRSAAGDAGGWSAQERTQTAFFTATFSVMGHLAKADGRVSEDEIMLARQVMAQMQLPEPLRKAAMHLFNDGKADDFPLDDVLLQLRSECHRRRDLMRVFMEIQMHAVYADGRLHPQEERLLRHVAQRLGFSADDYAQIESLVRGQRAGGAGRDTGAPTLEAAYAVLGVQAGDSDEAVKRAYRRLMNQHHPDKLVAKGLPEEMMKLATEKTQQIKAAYEQVQGARKQRA